MHSFLQRFSGIVLGILSGFDRLVFRGRLRRLYQPEGMNHYCNANHVFRKEFKEHARSVTAQVVQASLAEAKRCERYRYLNSSRIDKDQMARDIAKNTSARRARSARHARPRWRDGGVSATMKTKTTR